MKVNEFEQARQKAARDFLEHVVFIDDYLVGVASEMAAISEGQSVEIVAPPASPDELPGGDRVDGAKPGSTAEAPESPPEKEAPWHQVRVRPVAEAFADLGIVCGFFLLPKVKKGDEQSEKTKDRARRLASRADVVLVDWSLYGDSGAFATELLSWMDNDADTRRQLAVIYTGETDSNVIVQRLKNADAQLVDEHRALRFRLAKGTVVSVIQKPNVPSQDAFYPGAICATEDLPKRVVGELAEQVGGLLASVAMAGLARIRAHTHLMLRQFDQRADPAYVVHRAATVPTTDAEEQLTELFTDVVRDLLGDATWRDSATRDVIESWLALASPDDLVTFIRDYDPAFTGEDSKLLLLDGPSRFVEGKSEALSRAKRKAVERHFDKCYEKTVEALSKAHPGVVEATWRADLLRFAALSYCALRVGKAAPRLELGTVVEVEDHYWVCIQPLCDAARVPKEGRGFPFLRLTRVDVDNVGVFQLLVLDGETPIALKVEEKLYNMEVWPQKPAGEVDGPVLATDGDAQWWWPRQEGSRMRYVCSLRTAIAQRIANRLANTTGRVGLMESEYVRRRS